MKQKSKMVYRIIFIFLFSSLVACKEYESEVKFTKSSVDSTYTADKIKIIFQSSRSNLLHIYEVDDSNVRSSLFNTNLKKEMKAKDFPFSKYDEFKNDILMLENGAYSNPYIMDGGTFSIYYKSKYIRCMNCITKNIKKENRKDELLKLKKWKLNLLEYSIYP